MDANARYEKKETLLKYLDHARKIGAFDQILLIEEPLNEKNEESEKAMKQKVKVFFIIV